MSTKELISQSKVNEQLSLPKGKFQNLRKIRNTPSKVTENQPLPLIMQHQANDHTKPSYQASKNQSGMPFLLINMIMQQQSQRWVKLSSQKVLNLTSDLQQLYQSASYGRHTMFGFNTYSLKKQLEVNRRVNVMAVWVMYNVLSWERVAVGDVQEQVEAMPADEDQVEEIQVENNMLTLNKLNMSLRINLLSAQMQLVPKKYQLNRRLGKCYEKSISKISYELGAYSFQGKIRQIQSNQLLIFVRTDTQLSVINPQRKMKSFKISARDIKICGNRCYFVRDNGAVGSILLQMIYTPKLNQVALEETLLSDTVRKSQFLVSNDKMVMVVDVNVEDQYVSVRKLEGKRCCFPLNIEPEGAQCLVNKKATIHQNYLYLLLFLGIGKHITRLVEFKFLITDL